jgi:5'-3' exonuclease
VERDIKWSAVTGDETDANTCTLVADAGEAFDGVERAVNRLIDRFESDDVLLCISAGRNFRYDVDETYKANRKGTRKPVAYAPVLERAKETWPSFEHEGLEADDILGIFGSRLSNSIICSADKDMKTIPCTLWDGSKLRKVNRSEADTWFMYQVLVGDTADGYPGCPSVGPKKADAILKAGHQEKSGTLIENLWKHVKAAFEARGLTEADAIKQARLARILRDEDWDGKKKEPILWTPPT